LNFGAEGSAGPVTDGVVSYQSTHLAGAQAEIIVPSKHDSYGQPQALAFIRQQLLAE